jgi:hypothetical protein
MPRRRDNGIRAGICTSGACVPSHAGPCLLSRCWKVGDVVLTSLLYGGAERVINETPTARRLGARGVAGIVTNRPRAIAAARLTS